jgi:hypothetical protein
MKRRAISSDGAIKTDTPAQAADLVVQEYLGHNLSSGRIPSVSLLSNASQRGTNLVILKLLIEYENQLDFSCPFKGSYIKI